MRRTARGSVGTALGTLAAAAAACVAYGVLIERHWYRLRRETVPALEPGQPPCTVLHLSDFHLLAGDGRRQRFLAELAELPVDLAGLSDPHIRLDDLTVPVPANGDPSRLRIGVVHSPYQRSLNAFERSGYQLLLAGHTHGGQVRLPGVGALVTNCDLPRERVRGLSRWGSAWLHVSAGLGTSKYAPFRFACRPEATLLTLIAP